MQEVTDVHPIVKLKPAHGTKGELAMYATALASIVILGHLIIKGLAG